MITMSSEISSMRERVREPRGKAKEERRRKRERSSLLLLRVEAVGTAGRKKGQASLGMRGRGRREVG